jgi:hypothetical protein
MWSYWVPGRISRKIVLLGPRRFLEAGIAGPGAPDLGPPQDYQALRVSALQGTIRNGLGPVFPLKRNTEP